MADSKRDGSKRRDRAAELAAEMAGLAPAEPEAPVKTARRARQAPAQPKTAPRGRSAKASSAPAASAPRERATSRRTATQAPTRARVAPMPAETDGKAKATYPVRVPMQTNADQKRALEQARVDDGIQATARLRAMVALWMTDDRVRARVDKLALKYR